MSLKKEKCIIVGKSGSGKDYLMRKLVEKELKGFLKITTRPKREKEIQGVNYNFILENEFINLINNDDLLIYEKFEVEPKGKEKETWYYGISKNNFNESQVIIMTPGELSKIDKETRKNCFVVYLDIERKIREQRLLNRNDNNDSIIRRIESDEIDFKDFKDYDLKITYPDFSVDDIYDLMD